jgi:ABC-type methionine transport system ATPase subunit
MLLLRLISIMATMEDNSLVILEEPELHLDPSWTKQIVSLLVAFLSNWRTHLLVVTHSFAFVNAIPPEWVTLLAHNEPPRGLGATRSFLANEATLSRALYSPHDNLVEAWVMGKIANGTEDELARLFQVLGESQTRFNVFRRLVELRGDVGNTEQR